MADKGWIDSVPWLLAVLGWGFTHVFSESRERRKEVRSQLDKAIEQILSIEKSAREFHMHASFQPLKALDLTSNLDMLERKLHRITCLQMDDLLTRIIGIRRSVTLSNFDASSFQEQTIHSDIVGGITDAAASLEDILESQYRYRYPNKFPYFRIRNR